MSNYAPLSSVLDEDVATFLASGEFDEEWYVTEYPDVVKSGIDPARHYLWLGRRLGRQPSRMVESSVDDSKPTQESLINAQQSPVEREHEEQVGSEGGSGMRLIDRARRVFAARRSAANDAVYDLVAKHFDENFYLTKYPDVAAAGVDPVQHYIDNGWREGRDPSLAFSTKFYLDNNPDVAAAGVNPFYHYHAAGLAEGRDGKHQLGFRWDILAKLKPVSEQIREIKSHRAPPTISGIKLLEAALIEGFEGARKLVVSFSHDDFTHNVGGIQLLLRRELRLFRDRDDLHVHIFPEHPLPFLDTSGDEITLGVLVNGKLVGFYRAREIGTAVRAAKPDSINGSFIMHSLLGHNMDQTVRLLEACDMQEGLLWLHDYSPIYNNFKLLRNDVQYCGYPRPGTFARELCEFARADFCHAKEFSKLVDRFRVRLISPSQAALDIWQDAGALHPVSCHVVEHIKLRSGTLTEPNAAADSRPVRVGFLGYPADHKGWPVFQELALRHREDSRYEFFHLGKGQVGGLGAHYREVSASDACPDAMREAIEKEELDVALLWSIWPETFCLTAYEALAAGCNLITNQAAGNIIAAIEQTGHGLVLPDEKALHSVFATGELVSHARPRRTVTRYKMHYSALSLELLD